MQPGPVPEEGTGAHAPQAAETALVRMEPDEREPVPLSPMLGRLPVELDVAVPVEKFRVRDLVNLDVEQVIETRWSHGEDLPLAAGDVLLAWSEFEVVETKLAVRVTRLA